MVRQHGFPCERIDCENRNFFKFEGTYLTLRAWTIVLKTVPFQTFAVGYKLSST